jgi:hypothetical protein
VVSDTERDSPDLASELYCFYARLDELVYVSRSEQRIYRFDELHSLERTRVVRHSPKEVRTCACKSCGLEILPQVLYAVVNYLKFNSGMGLAEFFRKFNDLLEDSLCLTLFSPKGYRHILLGKCAERHYHGNQHHANQHSHEYPSHFSASSLD